MSTTLTIATPAKRHKVKYLHCGGPTFRRHAQQFFGLASGDAVCYRRDNTLEDLVISHATQCPWIHVGMIAWNADREEWEIIDTRQWRGGRRQSLIEAVRENPGHWDHFATNPGDRWPEYNRRLAVAKMDEFIDRNYGWGNLLRDALTHIPIVQAWFPVDLADGSDGGDLPFCSQAFALATRVGGGVDICPHRADRYTEPVHVVQSLFCEYRGTFVS